MSDSETKELEEAFIELPLVAVHTDNPISQVELRTNGDRVANVNGGTPQCNQVWGDFIVRAVNSHYKLVEVAEMAGNIAHNLLEDIGGIAGGPVMAGLRKLLAHANAAIADASK